MQFILARIDVIVHKTSICIVFIANGLKEITEPLGRNVKEPRASEK